MSGGMPRSDCNYKKKGLSRKERKQLQQEEAELRRFDASVGHHEKRDASDKPGKTIRIKKPGFSASDSEEPLPISSEDKKNYLRELRGLSRL